MWSFCCGLVLEKYYFVQIDNYSTGHTDIRRLCMQDFVI